jgi:hypothetical protein
MAMTYTGMTVTEVGEATIRLHIPGWSGTPAVAPKALCPDAKVGEILYGRVNMEAETAANLGLRSLKRCGYTSGTINSTV